jgi:hypothetical protein
MGQNLTPYPPEYKATCYPKTAVLIQLHFVDQPLHYSQNVVSTAKCGAHSKMWCPQQNVVSTAKCSVHSKTWCPPQNVVDTAKCGVHGKMWCPQKNVVSTRLFKTYL